MNFSSPLAKRRVHIFVMLLYIAVLLGSAMHIHGHDYDPLAKAEIENPPADGSTHHSSTVYSLCYVVAFAGSHSLEFKGFMYDHRIESVHVQTFETLGYIQYTLLRAQPLRGPPAV